MHMIAVTKLWDFRRQKGDEHCTLRGCQTPAVLKKGRGVFKRGSNTCRPVVGNNDSATINTRHIGTCAQYNHVEAPTAP